MATLYTFAISHYCEKARWSLDLCGLDYREVHWVPGPHVVAARRIAAGGGSVPILTSAGNTIQGSGAILDWLESAGRAGWHHEASSAERGEIERIEERADRGLGVAVRRLIYAVSLPTEPLAVARQLLRGASWRQTPLAWLMWPVTRRLIMSGLHAKAEDVPQARAGVEKELDHLDERLGDERRFLVGDRLTRADIAVASLISPIARPAQHPVYAAMTPWPTYRTIIEAYSDRPCVRWANDIYRDFRQV